MEFFEDNWKPILAGVIVVLVVILFVNKTVSGLTDLYHPSSIVPTSGGTSPTANQSPTP